MINERKGALYLVPFSLWGGCLTHLIEADGNDFAAALRF